MKFFTIGFTNKSANHFFDLLRGSGVNRILDVRINNGSQLAGFAKKDDLAYFLEKICGMDYVHLPDVGAHGLGPRLGLEMYRPRKTLEPRLLAYVRAQRLASPSWTTSKR